MKELNFEGLARLLLSQAREIVYKWLPGGKLVGAEYCCGSIRGEIGDSMRVNINKGLWQDFATGEKGGDLVSLYAAINGKSQGDAFRELSDEYNFEQNGTKAVAVIEKDDPIQPPKDVDVSNPLELFRHTTNGTPSGIWFYKEINGDLLFAIARYETRNGKVIIPWTWNRRGFWNCKVWPAPRPLYGLEYLKDHKGMEGKRVLIVEGEKAAVAARAIAGELYIVLTWSNGSKALNKTDFSPVKNMRVLLWPDNDKAGKEAMSQIAPILARQGCEVKILDPEGQVDGWDAADALEEGFDWSKFKEWATPRVSTYIPPSNTISATAVTQNEMAIAAAKAEVAVTIGEQPAIVTQSQREMWADMSLSLTKGDFPAINYDNVGRVLEAHPPLKDIVWYDEFHEKIFTKYKTGIRREWNDSDDAKMAVYFQRELGFQRMTKECVGQGIKLYAEERVQNEPKDWFYSLKWDGTERLSKFFHTYFGSDDNVYTSKAGMNFWVGMIARVCRPGCKLDNMIVLEGPQGIGKSRSMEVVGGPWYTEASESVQSKDFYMILQGKLVIEIAELDSFGKADVTRIKQVISCSKDRYRSPYDTHPEDHYRRSIFVGTTNEQAYLRDSTGGRRFWPMFCRKIKIDELMRDRDQLFAQALKHYEQNDEWYMMPTIETAEQQDSRRHRDDWEQVIDTFLLHRTEVTSPEIATDCLKIEIGRFDKLTQFRIAHILRCLGWERNKVKREGRTTSVWLRKQ